MSGRRTLAHLMATLVLVLAIASAVTTAARPGGGETYSGGGGSSSGSGDNSSWGGSGSDSDGDALGGLIVLILRLCWNYPLVGIPLLLIGLFFFASAARAPGGGNWDSIRNQMHAADVPAATTAVMPLDRIARVDPDFSAIVFEDFAFRLYATAHVARGEGTLDELSPYLSAAAREALAGRQPAGAVTGVVVGAMYPRDVYVPRVAENRPDAAARVALEFEANYSVGTGDDSRRFVVEEWVLRRAVSARTRPPEAGRRFPCPNCGAPWRADAAAGTQKCASCGEVVDNGRFDWQVVEIHLRRDRGNLPGLTEDVPERGTSLPTLKDKHFAEQWAAFGQADPAVTAAAVEARLLHVYTVLNAAWTRHDLGDARAVLSDGLADYLQYWLDAYDQLNLRNVLEDMRITQHELVRLRRDRYYAALTIRIWATGKDYVVRTDNDAHIRGSRTQERAYSEYWTLIRSAGRRGPSRTDAACGGCGAPLVVSMAGACSHCGAHVTAGEFDWVLSKIEQDDAYRG
jgi:hypothetical protein